MSATCHIELCRTLDASSSGSMFTTTNGRYLNDLSWPTSDILVKTVFDSHFDQHATLRTAIELFSEYCVHLA